MKERRTQSLRQGRVSLAGARYFVTCSAVRPCVQLVSASVADRLRTVWTRLREDGDIVPHCATIMPNHVHLLFTLTGRLEVGQTIGKFKALTRGTLAQGACRWQENFFEHRLRSDEKTDPFARYVFLNPYRADLVDRRGTWPHWMVTDPEGFDFMTMLEAGRFPPVDWLSETPEQMGVSTESVGVD